jgi:hypothetical protein
MDFRRLDNQEIKDLMQALRGNANDGGTILMDGRDTSFIGYSQIEPDDDADVTAIKSIPVHYAQ